MPWKKQSGGRYYYREKRVNGRLIRKYVGSGEHGEREAKLDADRRAARKAQLDAFHQAAAQFNEVGKPLQDLCGLTDFIMKASLTTAGYYQHDHGEWRCRRRLKHESQQTA